MESACEMKVHEGWLVMSVQGGKGHGFRAGWIGMYMVGWLDGRCADANRVRMSRQRIALDVEREGLLRPLLQCIATFPWLKTTIRPLISSECTCLDER